MTGSKSSPQAAFGVAAAAAATAVQQTAQKPSYFKYLKQAAPLNLGAGVVCEVWEIDVPIDEACLKEWASRFRQNYCPDSEIDVLRDGTGLSRAQYLTQLVFPDEKVNPGPGVRSGDFAELLIADFVEFMHGYWVPRGKYAEKGSRNESVKGVDIVGFKCPDADQPKPTDEMLTFEAKAQLSGEKYKGQLQNAVNDSDKDHLRKAETLAAMKTKMLRTGQQEAMRLVQRFQNKVDRPYKEISGAAAVLSGVAYDPNGVQGTDIAQHNNKGNLRLVVVNGKDLMSLVSALYQRAADEA